MSERARGISHRQEPYAPEPSAGGRRLRFTSFDWHRTDDRGDVAMVPCDRERPRDAPGLVGLTVDIDGALYTVRDVERFTRLTGPIRKGEQIGLWVDRVD